MCDLDSLKFNNSIKDILTDNKVINSDKFKCLECNEFIYKKELYQCKNGDCIKCGSCWEEQLLDKTNIKCDVIEFKDLARMKTTEISFGEKKVFCPFSFKFNKKEKDIGGCYQILEIKNLETHLSNCEYRFIKCDNKSNVIGEDCCGFIVRKNNVEDHKEECKYRIIKCYLCNNEMIRTMYERHELDCPSFIIDCYQCSMKLERKELQNHVHNICNETIVSCIFKEYGCESKIKRGDLSSHLELLNHYHMYHQNFENSLNDLKNDNNNLNIKLQNALLKLKNQEDILNDNEESIQDMKLKLKKYEFLNPTLNLLQNNKIPTFLWLNDIQLFNFKISSNKKFRTPYSEYNNKKLKIKIIVEDKDISFYVNESQRSSFKFNILLKLNHSTDLNKEIYFSQSLSYNKEKYTKVPFSISKKSLKGYLSKNNEIELIYSFKIL